MVNDILDFSKVEAGRVQLEEAEFSLRQCADDAITILAVSAREKGVGLILQLEPALPEVVIGDPQRLLQVFLNLVNNGVKFTSRGSVTLTIGVLEAREGLVRLAFRVADTGIGISSEQQAIIFEPFRQADGSVNRKYGGTGLGLAISSRLVGLMGGRLTVDSELGKGSAFSFVLSYKASVSKAPSFQATPSGTRWRENLDVLVAETTA